MPFHVFSLFTLSTHFLYETSLVTKPAWKGPRGRLAFCISDILSACFLAGPLSLHPIWIIQGFIERKKRCYPREKGDTSALTHSKCQSTVSFCWMSCIRSRTQQQDSEGENICSISPHEASKSLKPQWNTFKAISYNCHAVEVWLFCPTFTFHRTLKCLWRF